MRTGLQFSSAPTVWRHSWTSGLPTSWARMVGSEKPCDLRAMRFVHLTLCLPFMSIMFTYCAHNSPLSEMCAIRGAISLILHACLKTFNVKKKKFIRCYAEICLLKNERRNMHSNSLKFFGGGLELTTFCTLRAITRSTLAIRTWDQCRP